MNKKNLINYSFTLLNFLTAFLFSILLFKFTPYGLGASADSVGYIKAAYGLVNGLSFDYFTNVWPPLYSILLSIFGKVFDNDIIYGARVLNSIILATNYLLFLKIFNKFIFNKFIVYFLAVIAASHPLTLEIHLYAWTEPLFTSLFLINLLLLNKLFENISSKKMLIFSILISLVTGLSLMLRYAGAAILIGNIVTYSYFYFMNNIKIKNYILYLSSQIIIPFFICLPWYLYAQNRFNNVTGTHPIFNYPDLNKIFSGFNTIGSWIINIDVIKSFSFFNLLSVITGFFIIFSFFIYILYTSIKYKLIKHPLQIIFSISFITYFVFIILSSTFINIATPLDNRILSPTFPLILFQFVFYITLIPSKFIRTSILLIFMLFVVTSVQKFKGSLYFSAYNGYEYSSPIFKTRKIINFLKLCTTLQNIYSDTPWSLNLFIHQNTLWLPRKYNYTSGLLNPNYDSEIQALNHGENIIVLFEKFDEYSNLFSKMDFYKIYSRDDGEVWVKNNSLICSN